MTDLEAAKRAARQAAFVRRKAAHAADDGQSAVHLTALLGGHAGASVAGYMPIRSEIDPRPAMVAAAVKGLVSVPVIMGEGEALKFSRWVPGGPMREGPFGAEVPLVDDFVRPDLVIVPLVAFTRAGARLGYGGGFYDRTLAGLRAEGPTLAVGFAYAAQEADALPLGDWDVPLDMIVTDQGVIEI